MVCYLVGTQPWDRRARRTKQSSVHRTSKGDRIQMAYELAAKPPRVYKMFRVVCVVVHGPGVKGWQRAGPWSSSNLRTAKNISVRNESETLSNARAGHMKNHVTSFRGQAERRTRPDGEAHIIQVMGFGNVQTQHAAKPRWVRLGTCAAHAQLRGGVVRIIG